MHILHIDDDLVDRLTFKRVLRKFSEISCDSVAYVAEGETSLKTNTYNLIVSDYRLNDGSALDVLAYAGDTPVVVLSGSHHAEEVDMLINAGAIDCLAKPITVQVFEAFLATFTSEDPIASVSFDLSYLEELAEGDEEFTRQMLSIFVAEVPEALEQLIGELASEQWLAGAETVHKLKSKIRILGMHATYTHAEKAERDLRAEIFTEETSASIDLLKTDLSASIPLVKKMTQLPTINPS